MRPGPPWWRVESEPEHEPFGSAAPGRVDSTRHHLAPTAPGRRGSGPDLRWEWPRHHDEHDSRTTRGPTTTIRTRQPEDASTGPRVTW
ncbi:hypothetical protein GCM10018963_57040 [Saccharothrix longispora]